MGTVAVNTMNLLAPIQLPNGRTTSHLGLGCAGLLRLPTARGREDLLRTAVEAGITHFDVARMYGLGQAEGIVGEALKPVRDQVTLATKFGFPFVAQAPSALNLQSIARWAVNKAPGLKNAMRSLKSKAAPAPTSDEPAAGKVYSAEEMEQSLALSLTQLQTDRIDMLFLHAPETRDLIADDLVAALQRKKDAGQIDAFGFSGYRAELDYFLQAKPAMCGQAVQCHFSAFTDGQSGDLPSYPFVGVFGLLDGPLQSVCAHLSTNREFTHTWSDRLGLDLKSRENVAVVILALGLVLNPRGLVLFFTSSPKRLRHTVRGLTENTFSQENLREFREAVIVGLHAN